MSGNLLFNVQNHSFLSGLQEFHSFGSEIFTRLHLESILFDKNLDHMLVEFEQNRMVGTIQNVWLFDKNKKWLTIFDKEDVPVTETIV